MNEYKIHTFTNVGTQSFQVSEGGAGFEILEVSGGGAGASRHGGGGGGAGGLIYIDAETICKGEYPVVVGGGGLPAFNNRGFLGGNPIFGTYTAIGGGGGGQWNNGPGLDGGSCGGGAHDDNVRGRGRNTRARFCWWKHQWGW